VPSCAALCQPLRNSKKTEEIFSECWIVHPLESDLQIFLSKSTNLNAASHISPAPAFAMRFRERLETCLNHFDRSSFFQAHPSLLLGAEWASARIQSGRTVASLVLNTLAKWLDEAMQKAPALPCSRALGARQRDGALRKVSPDFVFEPRPKPRAWHCLSDLTNLIPLQMPCAG
jgi:hypothetical protein